jgi:hypothetical protein
MSEIDRREVVNLELAPVGAKAVLRLTAELDIEGRVCGMTFDNIADGGATAAYRLGRRSPLVAGIVMATAGNVDELRIGRPRPPQPKGTNE